MTNSELQNIKARFGIIGNAPMLNYAIQVAVQVSGTEMTVLINGESGSGKESFSKIIHSLSYRKHGQFIAINCGAIPEGTIDSELFGHVKGSFTGAIDERKGYFEVTDGGTIFLDEVAELPIGTQARLLRVLESGEFIRVGSSKVQKSNVRVIAATNVNLIEAVNKGKFREDLYYRLNTVPIVVPPLRERGMDIELLFRKFTSDFSEKYRIKPITLTTDAIQLLISYRFPGNIRQLKNIAEQISILEGEQRTIDGLTLKKYIPQDSKPTLPSLSVNGRNDNDFSERDILYRILFDLKKDVSDLKKVFYEIIQNGDFHSSEVLKKHPNLFDTNVEEFSFDNNPEQYHPMIGSSDNKEIIELDVQQSQRLDVLDIQHVTEEETLSLEKKEKEMIIRALHKNKNKRKYAAQALGISERTLYRKIKQYNIEDNED
jgi:transcriptional regulator with PAS, ATPase and Fis domain